MPRNGSQLSQSPCVYMQTYHFVQNRSNSAEENRPGILDRFLASHQLIGLFLKCIHNIL